MTPGADELPTWERAPRRPPHALGELLAAGCDISRSHWDVANLVVHLDLDYQNTDHPELPYTHPADVFFKLEPVFASTKAALARFGMPMMAMMTGRGYHFTGRVPLEDPVIDTLVSLTSGAPPWLATVRERSPSWVRPEILTARQGRAYVGWGLVAEFLAHEILRGVDGAALTPVVLNGTVVGESRQGARPSRSNLSFAGDPLDARHLRVAFGAYQVHRMREDVVGARVAREVPPLVAIPRRDEGLFELLAGGAHDARRRAPGGADVGPPAERRRGGGSRRSTPTASRGWRPFTGSSIRPARSRRSAGPAYDRIDLARLWPCTVRAAGGPERSPAAAGVHPARDRALLMAAGWAPRDIAAIVHERYPRDFGWGRAGRGPDPRRARSSTAACSRAWWRRPRRGDRLQLHARHRRRGSVRAVCTHDCAPIECGSWTRGRAMTWRFAASTGCCVDVPVLDVLERLREAKITAVELGTPPRHFDPWSHDQVRRLGEGLRRLEIEPIAIHAPFGGLLDLSDPNPHHRHAAMGAILSAASAVREVGGSRVVVHATDAVRTPQNVDERLSCCAASLIVLARACQHMEVTLLVETPLPHLVGGHPDELALLVRQLDRRVGVCFDTSHATLGHHWDRFVEVVGDRLMHVHANDHRGQFDDHLPPGDGVIDWGAIARSLDARRYGGWVMLELRCPEEPLDRYFRRAYDQALARMALA